MLKCNESATPAKWDGSSSRNLSDDLRPASCWRQRRSYWQAITAGMGWHLRSKNGSNPAMSGASACKRPWADPPETLLLIKLTRLHQQGVCNPPFPLHRRSLRHQEASALPGLLLQISSETSPLADPVIAVSVSNGELPITMLLDLLKPWIDAIAFYIWQIKH